MVINENIIVESESIESQSFINEIKKNIEMIISTPEGSIPLDRKFGLNMDFLGRPTEVAKESLSQEIIEKIELYEPRVFVEEIEMETAADNSVQVTIRISKNNEYSEQELDESDTDTQADEFFYDNEDYGADENIGEEDDE